MYVQVLRGREMEATDSNSQNRYLCACVCVHNQSLDRHTLCGKPPLHLLQWVFVLSLWSHVQRVVML